MKGRMKVYISGKVSGLPYEVASRNFEEAVRIIEELGHEAVNPLAGEPLGLTWEQYMRRDIEKMMGCDAIYTLPNWHDSKGAILEVMIASELGMPDIRQRLKSDNPKP